MTFIDTILRNPRKRILKNMTTDEVVTYEIQDDPDNVIQQGTKLNSETFEQFKEDLLLEAEEAMRPIGSFFITDSAENPADTFGFGTWERIKGVTFVGVDEEDDDFDTVGQTVGSKTQNLRALIGASHNTAQRIGYQLASKVPGQNYNYSVVGSDFINGVNESNINHSTNVLKSDGNLPTTIQPSYCTYIWKRIA